MGRLAMGSSALGMSLGVDVKVLKDAPGPQRISAWKPGEGSVAWGMAVVLVAVLVSAQSSVECQSHPARDSTWSPRNLAARESCLPLQPARPSASTCHAAGG